MHSGDIQPAYAQSPWGHGARSWAGWHKSPDQARRAGGLHKRSLGGAAGARAARRHERFVLLKTIVKRSRVQEMGTRQAGSRAIVTAGQACVRKIAPPPQNTRLMRRALGVRTRAAVAALGGHLPS